MTYTFKLGDLVKYMWAEVVDFSIVIRKERIGYVRKFISDNFAEIELLDGKIQSLVPVSYLKLVAKNKSNNKPLKH